MACATGASNKDVAAQLGSTPHAVGRWRKRFVEHRIAGLGDMPRSGGPRTVTDEQVAAVVKRTLETAPKNATHWSTRAMAQEMGLSQSTVSRIWRAFGLQPHRTETFNPRFHLHFTPTGSSWLNLVERWFAELTNKQIRRGVHKSVQALEKDIRTWIAAWNTDPKPYVWTKTADQILERLASYLNRIPDSED
jgi:transposase